MKFDLLHVNLRLFDGVAGAGASASGESAGIGGNSGGSQADPGSTHRGGLPTGAGRAGRSPAGARRATGEYQNVRFGKQEQPNEGGSSGQANPSAAGKEQKTGVVTTSDALEEKRRAYRSMVDGEYKDIYTEDTQRIIDRRFRETRNLEQQVSRQQPVIDMLMQRYNISDGDLDKLTAAIENDNAYWSQAAEEAGMSVESFKQLQKLQRENAALLQAQRNSRSQQAAQQQLQKWYSEGEQVKQVYPGFDLAMESQNPQFISLLKSGVPVQTAYEVIHMDEIKTSVAQASAQQTEKQVVNGIRAKGARPAENGTSAQSAFTVKDDPSKWTKKDRAEIARRVARGETIKL